MLHLKGMAVLQPTDEHDSSDVIATVIHQRQLALEITDIAFEAFFLLHTNGEKVVVVLFKLLT